MLDYIKEAQKEMDAATDFYDTADIACALRLGFAAVNALLAIAEELREANKQHFFEYDRKTRHRY